ncbi:hypothetical protein JV173_02490 [Acholeplasma equirhinis]|uniref:hypothetical protein n=1 Tax=Acholeplasma equirhinis TaxID=555393 RepID=UPI00197A7E92|nr:hypothetical protein [Acholeplasma equirhinis]MBN3490376.1 hypothetical protein [Acholeplasma equirhinis]
MIFWTLLLSSMFVMVILYILIGYQKLWLTFSIYAILALTTAILIYFFVKDLYTFDLFSLIIPGMILFPLHFFVNNIMKYYVLPKDDTKSKFFVAFYSRILATLWIMLGILILGDLLTLIDVLNDTLKVENIWSLAVTSIILLIVLYLIISNNVKKNFSIILIVGKASKRVYKMSAKRSLIKVSEVLNQDLYVKARGIYHENGELHYIYYIEDEINMENTAFKPYQSDLYEAIKDACETFEGLEHKYNEYIDNID